MDETCAAADAENQIVVEGVVQYLGGRGQAIAWLVRHNGVVLKNEVVTEDVARNGHAIQPADTPIGIVDKGIVVDEIPIRLGQDENAGAWRVAVQQVVIDRAAGRCQNQARPV